MLYGYTRVSSAEQVAGSSLSEQEARVKGVAMMRGAALDRIFSDPGVSGSIRLSSRPLGGELIRAILPGDTLIVSKLDRAFRSAADALSTVDIWRERGIDLIVADMGSEPVTQHGAGKLFFGMLALVAEFERDRILERVMDGRASKRAAGGHLGGRAPFGYQVDGAGRAAMLRPIEIEQDAIVRIQELRMHGLSLRDIAGELRERGHEISHVTVRSVLLRTCRS